MSISNHDDSLNDKPEKLDQELTEDSWDNFIRDPNIPVPSDQLRSRIEQKIGPMAIAPVKKMRYAWSAVAASVILLAGAFFLTNKKDKPAQTTAAAHPPAQQPPPVTKEITNDAASTMSLLLPDGSKVALSGNSTLKYYTPFIDGKRDIYLKGAARFTVAKNEKMPFIVHTKDITTTVLGTVFSVSDKQSRFTTVHLFSGKVVVKKEAGQSFNAIYLTPGEELVIDKQHFTTELKYPSTLAARQHKDSAASTAISQPLQFDNLPLEQIFRQLQQSCHITIGFDAARCKNMTFTGKFNYNKETVGSFLQTLCDLNELTLTKTDEAHYMIH